MIDLRNLERSYKTGHTETFVLRRVNLTINPGEFLTIMGPSGAGKSSLLNVLAMLDDQWRGEFFFEDLPVHELNRKQRADLARRRIGMVFQSYHLLDDLTVAENIDLPLSYKDIPARRTAGTGRRHARPLSDRRQKRPLPIAALRGSAAARRHRPCRHSQALAAARRRAHRQSPLRPGRRDHGNVPPPQRGRHHRRSGDAFRHQRRLRLPHHRTPRWLAYSRTPLIRSWIPMQDGPPRDHSSRTPPSRPQRISAAAHEQSLQPKYGAVAARLQSPAHPAL